jgi:hypothetical protein
MGDTFSILVAAIAGGFVNDDLVKRIDLFVDTLSAVKGESSFIS